MPQQVGEEFRGEAAASAGVAPARRGRDGWIRRRKEEDSAGDEDVDVAVERAAAARAGRQYLPL